MCIRDSYKAACARDSKSPGKYVSPALAEHFAGYALRLKLSRYSNRSRHVSGSGLPTNWTNPSIGSVSKRDVELACPWKTLPSQAVQVQVFQSLRVSCPQLQAKKHRVLSLFTGVAGLELGASQSGPHHLGNEAVEVWISLAQVLQAEAGCQLLRFDFTSDTSLVTLSLLKWLRSKRMRTVERYS